MPENHSSTTPSNAVPFWGKISFLWLLLVPIICAIYTLLLPIAPNDFWYNVRAGAHIVQSASIPTTALFTTSLPSETPYYYQSWLAQIALFKTLQSGGLSGIILLRTFCLTTAFAISVCTAWRCVRGINSSAARPLSSTTLARIVALSTLLSFMLAASNMDIRPQTFSVLLFAIWTFFIFEWPHANRRSRQIGSGVLALLMALWANTHGGFFTGLIVLATLFVGESLHFLLSRKYTQINAIFGEKPGFGVLRALGIALALCIAAAILNPRGAMIFFYVFQLAGLKAGQKFIQEWQSPSLDQWYGALFFAALLGMISLAGVLCKSTRLSISRTTEPVLGVLGLRLGESAVLVVMAILALRDIRSIIWFAFLMAPAMAAMMARLLCNRAGNRLSNRAATTAPEESPPKSIQIVNAIIALLLILGVAPFLPAIKPYLGLPSEYSSHFAPTPRGVFPSGFGNEPPLLLERDTPVEAVAYLQQHPPRGRIWNDMVFGSYLTWAGFPRLLPHCDPRVEMYSYEFWEEYGRLLEGPPDAARTLRAQGFSDALLHIKDEKPLIARLKQSGWKILLQKGNAVLLRDGNPHKK